MFAESPDIDLSKAKQFVPTPLFHQKSILGLNSNKDLKITSNKIIVTKNKDQILQKSMRNKKKQEGQKVPTAGLRIQ